VDQPKPGDRIRLTLQDGARFEGILMPRHSFSGQDILTVKLDNGYNVGLLAEGARMELLEPGKPTQRTWAEPPHDPAKPTIAVLGTGGTIASFVDYRTGGVQPATRPEELVAAVPGLSALCNVRAEVLFNMFSEDMQPEHWSKIAERAAWHLNNGARGVVIPHGTDTLSFTSAALAFALKGLNGPVVLVGSQRSSDRPSSDASMNLLAAARVAATTDLGEVVVVMHETSDDRRCAIHRGTRVRKMHTSRRDAFQSINVPPLGHVTGDRITWTAPAAPRAKGPTRCDAVWDEEVSMILSYPGLWPEHIQDVVRKATVIVGTGLGHISRRCLPGIQEVTARGAHVVMASQCINGAVNMNVYSTGRDLLQMGVLPAQDMTPEAAYIKMMWILGHTSDPKEVRKLFLTNLAGEMDAPVDLRAFVSAALPTTSEAK
jgi:glutamyl-tRNA(Gln) amidotransferase subunit D